MTSLCLQPRHSEQPAFAVSGWLMVLVHLIGVGALAWLLMHLFSTSPHLTGLIPLVGGMVAWFVALGGYFVNPPNQATVITLAGAYAGSVRRAGFHWTNPLTHKVRVSLRARNLTGDKLKVNDLRGNPIEIGAVVVWRVSDAAQALFDVDNYATYVATQSESALRHLASSYAYDNGEAEEVTLRGGGEAISAALMTELHERLARAGVAVEEARIMHLAYAPEIAQAMLRRQQADAVIAARSKIVTGAVTMVEMALNQLSERHVVQLDEERKASMVSNLLVVLCGESDVHPVVNAGTLYS